MDKQSITEYLEQQGEGLTTLFYYTLQKAQSKPKRQSVLKTLSKELFKGYSSEKRQFVKRAFPDINEDAWLLRLLLITEVEEFVESIKVAMRSLSSQPWYNPRKIAGDLSLVFIILYLGFERIIVTIHNEEQVVVAVVLVGLYLMLEELEHSYKANTPEV